MPVGSARAKLREAPGEGRGLSFPHEGHRGHQVCMGPTASTSWRGSLPVVLGSPCSERPRCPASL